MIQLIYFSKIEGIQAFNLLKSLTDTVVSWESDCYLAKVPLGGSFGGGSPSESNDDTYHSWKRIFLFETTGGAI